MGRLEEAERDYKRALELRPSSVDTLNYLAAAQERLGGGHLRDALQNLNQQASML